MSNPHIPEPEIARMSRRDAGLRQVLADIEHGARRFGNVNEGALVRALIEGGFATWIEADPVMSDSGGMGVPLRRMELTDAGRAEIERLRAWATAYADQFEWWVTRGVRAGHEGPEEQLAGPFATRAESDAWAAEHNAQAAAPRPQARRVA